MTLQLLRDLALVELTVPLTETGGILFYHPKARPRLVVSSYLPEEVRTEIKLRLVAKYYWTISNEWNLIRPFEITEPMPPRPHERPFTYSSSGGGVIRLV